MAVQTQNNYRAKRDAVIPGYTWDGKLGRFRNKSTGRITSNKQILALQKGRINSMGMELDKSLDDLFSNKITFSSWQRENLNRIKTLHAQQLMLGSGGYQNVSNAEWLALARELKNLHYPAFRKLSREIKDRKLSEKQIRARLKLFAKASRGSAEIGRKNILLRSGWLYAKRHLGSCAPHCQDCLEYASWGIVAIADLIPPATNCQCGANCCCTVEYLRAK